MTIDTPRTQVTFRMRASLEYRSLAIDVLSTLIAHVTTADGVFRDELITAFGEAFNNVVMHGYRERADGMLEVEAEMGMDEMTIRLIDSGRPADFAAVRPPDLESMPEGGLGIFMMRAMVDEVSYVAGEVNVLTLTKRTRDVRGQP